MDKPNAIITGAAKGIGKAIAKRLKKEGFFCILIDVDQENGKELTKEFEGSAKFFN